MASKMILLTGASGFIGRNLARQFFEKGHVVFAPVRPQSRTKVAELESFESFQVLEAPFYNLNLNQKVDVIVHSAAIRGAGQAEEDEYRKVNVHGTQKLLALAKKLRAPRFLFISTVGVLGTIPAQLPAKSDTPAAPDGIYHKTKFEAEQLVQAQQLSQLKTLILRPTITYGPGDDGFLQKLVSLVKQKFMVLPAQEILIHLLDVNAFARFVEQVVENDQFNDQVYLVADRQPVALQKLAALIAEIIGGRFWQVPGTIFNLAKKTCELLKTESLLTSLKLISQSWYYDVQPAVEDLGYRPVETTAQIERYLKENVYR